MTVNRIFFHLPLDSCLESAKMNLSWKRKYSSAGMSVRLTRERSRVRAPLLPYQYLSWKVWFFFINYVWARSLAGKALRSQRRDRGFESHRVHQKENPPTRRFFFLYFSLLSLHSSLFSAMSWRLFQIRDKREKWQYQRFTLLWNARRWILCGFATLKIRRRKPTPFLSSLLTLLLSLVYSGRLFQIKDKREKWKVSCQ